MRNIIRFLKNQQGTTAIEYGMVAALIAVCIVGALVTLGPALRGVGDRLCGMHQSFCDTILNLF